jgi:hypothetical protein
MSPIPLFESFFCLGAGGMTIVADSFFNYCLPANTFIIIITYFPAMPTSWEKNGSLYLRAVA